MDTELHNDGGAAPNPEQRDDGGERCRIAVAVVCPLHRCNSLTPVLLSSAGAQALRADEIPFKSLPGTFAQNFATAVFEVPRSKWIESLQTLRNLAEATPNAILEIAYWDTDEEVWRPMFEKSPQPFEDFFKSAILNANAKTLETEGLLLDAVIASVRVLEDELRRLPKTPPESEPTNE
jgi:hypothetical protein